MITTLVTTLFVIVISIVILAWRDATKATGRKNIFTGVN